MGITLKAEVMLNLTKSSAMTCVFDQGNGLVNVMLVESQLFEWNEAVNAWEWGIMWDEGLIIRHFSIFYPTSTGQNPYK